MTSCDCHGRNHREETLTYIIGVPDYANGDPAQSQQGVSRYCPAGLRERQQRTAALEKARRGRTAT